MHDKALEQKLRAVLQAEGDGPALTITAAELERRFALRRRGGPSRFASLGLAAAVGVTLLGLAGVAGGWFEQAPVVPGPLPSASTPASAAPSIGPAILPSGVASDRLPSLGELLAPLDPTRIVRAQAVGPAEGRSGTHPSREEIGPMAVGFAPITTPGVHRLTVGCIGTAELNVVVTNDQPSEPREFLPITCNGGVTSRDIGLAAGDRMALRSTSWLSWRVVLEAPARDPFHALEAAPLPELAAGQIEVAAGRNESEAPRYEGNQTGGGVLVPVQIGSLPARDGYTVRVACAGPTTLRYTFGYTISGTDTTADGTIEENVATEVECDGTSHTDAIDIVDPVGASVFVTVDDRTAWAVSVTAEAPPIEIEPNGDGWQMVTASGPDLHYDGSQTGLSGATSTPGGGEIRVVVTCTGGGFVDVTVRARDFEDPALASFQADCVGDGPQSTAQIVRIESDTVLVDVDPSGKMWRAVTIQERAASPAP